APAMSKSCLIVPPWLFRLAERSLGGMVTQKERPPVNDAGRPPFAIGLRLRHRQNAHDPIGARVDHIDVAVAVHVPEVRSKVIFGYERMRQRVRVNIGIARSEIVAHAE